MTTLFSPSTQNSEISEDLLNQHNQHTQQIFEQIIVPKETCDFIINTYLKYERLLTTDRYVTKIYDDPCGDHSDYLNNILFRPQINSVFDIPNNAITNTGHNESDLMDKIIRTLLDNYFYSFYGLPNTPKFGFQKPVFMRYTEGDYFKLHSDNTRYCEQTQSWVDMFGRSHSLLVYLNDGSDGSDGNNTDFSGGELYFPRLNKTITPKTGLVVIFPNNHPDFDYEVLKVISGVRYNLVTWLSSV